MFPTTTWVGNRNIAETTYRNTLSVAHNTKISNRTTADTTHVSTLASQRELAPVAKATRLHARYVSIAAATTLYANGVGQAEHDYQVALANARHAHAYTGDGAAYNTAVQQAVDDRKNAIEASNRAYATAEAVALANQISTDATADYNLAIVGAAAGSTRTKAHQCGIRLSS